MTDKSESKLIWHEFEADHESEPEELVEKSTPAN